VSSFDDPDEHGFKIDKKILQHYVKTFGPITLVGGKYACQTRRGSWECYDKFDRRIPTDKIMDEFDLKKYGFSFDDFIDSYRDK
jgi:hypothetical protein